MKTSFLPQMLVIAVAAAGVAGLAHAQSAAKPPKLSIEEVMEKANKGRTSLFNRIVDGQGTPEDFKQLVAYYENLPGAEPPKGDKASWKEKTEVLLAAAKGVAAGKPNAIEALKTAGNCKACHSVHKPD